MTQPTTYAIVSRNTDGTIRAILEGGFDSATSAGIASIERYGGIPRITIDTEPVVEASKR